MKLDDQRYDEEHAPDREGDQDQGHLVRHVARLRVRASGPCKAVSVSSVGDCPRQMEGQLTLTGWIGALIVVAVIACVLAWVLSDPDYRPPRRDYLGWSARAKFSGGLYC